jgi:putative inorganic carbon (hco3(-)) transporter
MDYLLFLMVNAILFLRPSEIIPELAGVRIYETVIVCCLVCSLLSVARQFSLSALAARPITVGVLLFWPLCGLSQLMRLDLTLAGDCFWDFFKIVVYYLLLVGVVNTPARLRNFLAALAVFITVLTMVAVLRYYGVITITPPPMIKLEEKDRRDKKDDGTSVTVDDKYFDNATGEEKIVKRLRGTGIFNDPNDLCLALVTGILLCLYGLGEARLGPARVFCVLPLGLFMFALRLTSSRGGLLGLVAGLGVLFTCRYGWRKAVLLGGLALPVMLAVFGGGRMTDISQAASEGTGQARLQLWRDGMVLFKEQPLFGVGMNEYQSHARQVAHNSFLHAFTELGIAGGTVFLGLFYCAFFGLRHVQRAYVLDRDLHRMLPYMLALVGAYGVGILSLSRNYEVPTYTMLGLAAAYLAMVPVYPAGAKLRCSGQLALRVEWLSLIFLLFTDLVVRFFAV